MLLNGMTAQKVLFALRYNLVKGKDQEQFQVHFRLLSLN